ncbi:hypothetical protein E6Q11_04265 [Candidatus Dojkabacteria bacterium]|uniref:YqaJ viral recombinase domain-containing protein n=1 Tax=Candidatus Dojkabacteria bacterium TaxID=2099670 RepID=A0A5C7J7S7_9BACT|nr:MAG: hypothetical protein E6Q11_04265 [Candidatus Dojkabacteria bacterium]
MKIVNVDQNSTEWLEARKGKITGSKLKDIVVKRGTEKKIGFYQLIADRLALDDNSEDGRDRGHSLEDESIDTFKKETGLNVVKTGLWISDENPNIAISPDGAIEQNGVFTMAVETKSLSSARHLQAYIEKEIPDEFELQKIQYFIVNENLQTLYFCFYDPRVTVIPFFYIKVDRKDIEEQIEFYLDYQKNVLQEVDKIISELSF